MVLDEVGHDQAVGREKPLLPRASDRQMVGLRANLAPVRRRAALRKREHDRQDYCNEETGINEWESGLLIGTDRVVALRGLFCSSSRVDNAARWLCCWRPLNAVTAW